MNAKTWLLALVAAAAASGAHAADPRVLVRYDFDQETVQTGPYTLMVFENSRGSVRLTSRYRYSGHRSVEIRDVAGDGDFAELQGYFAPRSDGTLFVHFALMTAQPSERFNVALAGPARFTMQRDGIAFWLKNREGLLHEVSAREDRPLLELRPFVWYRIDVVCDIEGGTYDLEIRAEDAEVPVVAVKDRPNAIGEPGSVIHQFSFIGDLPGLDGSEAHLFVDDIVISADRPVRQAPFVAPGRRVLFMDMWGYWRKHTYREPECPPVLDHADFGLDASDLHALSEAGALEFYERLIDPDARPGLRPEGLSPHVQDLLDGVALWRRACTRDGECRELRWALWALDEARERLPEARIVPMSRAMLLAGEGRWKKVDELLLAVYPEWHDDPRFPSLSAVLGVARGNLDEAETWLSTAPGALPDSHDHPLVRRLWTGEVDRALLEALRAEIGEDAGDVVRTALVVEHRYYVMLWQERFAEARDYAWSMVARLRELGEATPSRWLERVGDAAFHEGDYEGAREAYERALVGAPDATSTLLKLSDVHFRLGNADLERAYREKIYGTLDPGGFDPDPAPGVTFDRCSTCPGPE